MTKTFDLLLLRVKFCFVEVTQKAVSSGNKAMKIDGSKFPRTLEHRAEAYTYLKMLTMQL